MSGRAFGSVTCERCGDVFDRERSVEEAHAEGIARHGAGEDLAEVCDDCFRAMGFDPDRPEALPPGPLLADAITRFVSSVRWQIISEEWRATEPPILLRRVWLCLQCKSEREVIGPGRPTCCGG